MSTSDKPASIDLRQTLALIGWGALCLAAAVLGGTVSIDEWYTSLQKPDWNPRLDLWSGLDSAVSHDECGSLAGVA